MTSRRFYRLFSGGLGLFLSQTALAIGIGDIAVDSYVNEPLSARIAILDPAETALDLARAYLDMGDKTGAKELLETAISMGDDAQVEVAKQLLASIE
jgi:FimV-like protein